jgi:hypothetical protein
MCKYISHQRMSSTGIWRCMGLARGTYRLHLQVIRSSETLVLKTATRRHIPRDDIIHSHQILHIAHSLHVRLILTTPPWKRTRPVFCRPLLVADCGSQDMSALHKYLGPEWEYLYFARHNKSLFNVIFAPTYWNITKIFKAFFREHCTVWFLWAYLKDPHLWSQIIHAHQIYT